MNTSSLISNLIYIIVFFIGSCFGSFFKLIIDRYNKISFIDIPSRCEYCKKNLQFWQNIPILSYLLLRGKCYFCKEKLSKEYFFMEFLSGLFFLIGYIFLIKKNTPIPEMFYLLCFILLLFFISIFDLKYKIVFQELIYGFIIFTICFYFFINKDLTLAFINLGLGFITMDILYILASLIKGFKINLSPLSVPILAWLIIFQFNKNPLFSLIAILIFFITTSLEISSKTNLILWIINIAFITFVIIKSIVFLNYTNNINLFCGLGLIYFFCEVLAYFIPTKEKDIAITDEALGGGDITTIALISTALGFKIATLSLFLGSFFAILSLSLGYVVNKKLNLSKQIPFIPYISFACFIMILIT